VRLRGGWMDGGGGEGGDGGSVLASALPQRRPSMCALATLIVPRGDLR